MDKEIFLDEETLHSITQFLNDMDTVKEKFRKIQENPDLYNPENSLSTEEQELLEKLLNIVGASSIAGNEISERSIAAAKKPH